MTLNTQQDAKTPLRRRASTPLPLSARGHQPGLLGTAPSTQSQHPRLGQSVSLNAPTWQPSPAPNGWSSESSDSESSWEALYRVVLLGDPGVGKTSLASLFAGKQERDLREQLGGRSLWAGLGCGQRSQIPVIWDVRLPRTTVQLLPCSALRGVVHPSWEVNEAPWSCAAGEGNGSPLQCSCLENPRDGGAWWAAVYGVAQSLTRLKRLSSSSSRAAEGMTHTKIYRRGNSLNSG